MMRHLLTSINTHYFDRKDDDDGTTLLFRAEHLCRECPTEVLERLERVMWDRLLLAGCPLIKRVKQHRFGADDLLVHAASSPHKEALQAEFSSHRR